MKSEFVFLALIPEEESRLEMDALKQALSCEFAAKKALSSTSHITLYPPIHVTPDQLTGILKEMCRWIEGSTAFNIHTCGISCFGTRTVFIDVENSDALNAISERVRAGMKAMGHPELLRPFKPHFTLLNRDCPQEACEEVKAHYHKVYLNRCFKCHSFCLFRRNALNTAWDIYHECLM